MTAKINLNNAYCLAPWVNVNIDRHWKTKDLTVRPCCRWYETYNSVENYFAGNNPTILNLKNQLIANEPSTYCQQCKERDWYSEFKDFDLEIDQIKDYAIKSVDIRWSSTCQLTCLYCGAGHSSSWAALKHTKDNIPIESNRIKETDYVFDTISRFDITRVSMLGGEPLLLKENSKLLDIISDDTAIEIFTNLNVDLDNNDIYQKLTSRSNVNWYVSMETVGTKFEFVRRGSSWDQQVKNLKKLTSTNPKAVSLQSQYCAYSAFDLVDLYEFCSQHNLDLNLVCENFSVKVLDVFSYPTEFKKLALDEIDKSLEKFPQAALKLIPIKNKLIKDMDIVVPNIIEDCVNWHQQQETKFFDNRFNFVELWPQFGKTSL